MGANGTQGVASLDPRDMVGRIYVGDNYALIHTKYIKLWAINHKWQGIKSIIT